MVTSFTKNLSTVSKSEPCRHCGKPDWCYRVGDLEVCKRQAEPATGWKATGKTDSDGTPYYAPITEQKSIRPRQTRCWEYPTRDGDPLVRVARNDDGSGNKKIWQERWDGYQWVKGTGAIPRAETPIYRYQEVREAIAMGQPVYIVEGEVCADALWKLGLAATTNIGGSGKWRPSDSADLKGAEIVICPDRDKPGLKHALDIAQAFPDAQYLLAFPNSSAWRKLPDTQGVDIADWINDFKLNAEDIKQAVMDLDAFRAKLEDTWKSNDKTDQPRSKTERRHQKIKRYWGDRLRLNELKNIIELDEKPLELDTLSIRLAHELDMDIPREEAIAICTLIAKQNSYNPVRDYLNHVSQECVTTDIDNLATRWLGASDRLANIYLKRYLIGAVARIYEPGCQNDTSLILQGKQGFKKSTFFRVLHQGSKVRESHQVWFDDTMSDTANKDERDKLHRFWCLEWAELERVLRRGDDLVKAFLTTKADTYRPPYGREPITKLRQSVIVGTTNRDEFLSDDTGDRRFWTIKVQQRIDTAQVEAERDQVWSSAVAAYKAGEQWYLTDEEQELSAEANAQFHTSDAWQQYVEAYIEGLGQTTTAHILEHGLQFDKAKQDRASQMRVSSIMHRLGWQKGKIYVAGKRLNGWVSPTAFAVQPVQPVQPTLLEVGQGSDDATSRFPTVAVQPVQPFSQNFSEKNEVIEKNKNHIQENQQSLKHSEVSQVGQAPLEPLQPKASEPVQPTVQPQQNSVEVGQVGQQVDFSSFPYEGKENQYSDGIKCSIAFGIKVKLEQCQTKDDFAALRDCGEYSKEQLNWVRKNLISPEEQERFKRIVTQRALGS